MEHRFLIKETLKHIGENLKIAGWVNSKRSHGKILFLDIRDKSGILQVVFTPSEKEAYDLANKVKSEWVVEIEGTVVKRPSSMVNPKIETGVIEMAAKELKILSQAQELPFFVDKEGYDIKEELRMKYRYLDLRRERLRDNLIMRHKIVKFIRDFLDKEDFIEIETPILTKSTPEGARDFLVPSRVNKGNFYALPQSPQQFKQLLMVAGFERYFQIARCFRDEDPRGDRQPEFTQLDLEMSFVEREEIMDLIERLLITLVKVCYPHKKIQDIPFPKLTYFEAIEKYKSDKPDLRRNPEDTNTLAFCWIIDFPFFEKQEDGSWTFTHNPFSAPKKESLNDLIQKRNIENILSTQYDIILNGFEIGGGSLRNYTADSLSKVFEIIGYKKKEIEEKFGHMLKAFKFGAPPHGGIALGLDRLVALLQNEPNIREVIAFPKTGDGRDLMMEAPSSVSKEQLEELGIRITKTKKASQKIFAKKQKFLKKRI